MLTSIEGNWRSLSGLLVLCVMGDGWWSEFVSLVYFYLLEIF